MDRTRVAIALVGVASLAAVGAALAPGALPALFGTEGYHPPTEDGPGAGTTNGTTTPVNGPTGTPTDSAYDHVRVVVVDENGTTLGEVRAAVADTAAKRYTGLSKTEHLPPDRGMLFVHERTRNLTYVMREMSFGIDIVFVGADGTVRRIHHAPEPPEGEDGEQYRYPGRGKYVLEVNYRWTAGNGVSVGDRVRVEGAEGVDGLEGLEATNSS